MLDYFLKYVVYTDNKSQLACTQLWWKGTCFSQQQMLHSKNGQTTLEVLPLTDQDIDSEACYAKHNLLEVGGALPITAVQFKCQRRFFR